MRLALCALVAVLVLSCSAYAANTAYTSESAFLSSIAPGYYLEQFSGFSDGDPLGGDPSPTDYNSPTVNGFSWNVHAPNGLWSLSGALSAAYPYEALVITFRGAPVTAVGGIFEATDFEGQPIPGGLVHVALADGTTQTVTSSGFAGFTSTTAIQSISITPVACDEGNWSAFRHLYVGTASGAASVPEPSSIVSILTGLVAAGSMVMRRRRG